MNFVKAIYISTLLLSIFIPPIYAVKPKDEVVYHFPSPSEVMFYIRDSKLPYKSGFSNSPSNVERYLDRNKQATNLGIYMADFAYHTVFNETSVGAQYLITMKSLGYKLRINFNSAKDAMNQYGSKQLNTDSLIYNADLIFNNMMDYCDQNKLSDIFALITLGGYVECLYLTINYVGDFSAQSPLVEKIADQKFLFDNFSKYLESINKKMPADYLADVYRFKKFYSKLKLINQKVKVTKVGGKVVITGGTRYEINEQQFSDLKKLVTEVRTKYVGIE